MMVNRCMLALVVVAAVCGGCSGEPPGRAASNEVDPSTQSAGSLEAAVESPASAAAVESPSSVRRGSVEVIDYTAEGGGKRLVLTVDSCGGRPAAEVDERAQEVKVLVRTDVLPPGPECADIITIRLNHPLGDRRLLDRSTGQTVGEYDK